MTDILLVEKPVINIDEYSMSVVEVGVEKTTIATCEIEPPSDFVIVESTAIIEVECCESVVIETVIPSAEVITVEMGIPGPSGTGEFFQKFEWTTTQW